MTVSMGLTADIHRGSIAAQVHSTALHSGHIKKRAREREHSGELLCSPAARSFSLVFTFLGPFWTKSVAG